MVVFLFLVPRVLEEALYFLLLKNWFHLKQASKNKPPSTGGLNERCSPQTHEFTLGPHLEVLLGEV